MTTGRNADGTIDVRVVLTVRVDPDAWAADMMGDEPDETLLREIRKDVKRWVRNHIAEANMDGEYPIGDVTAQGIYP